MKNKKRPVIFPLSCLMLANLPLPTIILFLHPLHTSKTGLGSSKGDRGDNRAKGDIIHISILVISILITATILIIDLAASLITEPEEITDVEDSQHDNLGSSSSQLLLQPGAGSHHQHQLKQDNGSLQKTTEGRTGPPITVSTSILTFISTSQ